MKRFYTTILLLSLFVACTTINDLPKNNSTSDWKVKKIPSYIQQRDGDATKGLEYLIYGDYIGSGVPLEFYGNRFSNKDTVFHRTGINENLPHVLTAFTAANGVEVMSGNCFTCHSAEINGQIIPGLGNHLSDYDKNWSQMASLVNLGMKLKYKKDSKEWEAYEDFGHYFKAMAPTIETNQFGVNPAFRLAEACMNFRNPSDLTYKEEPNYDMTEYPIATDVPPLWNVKKKNGLYYNGIGRGDFTKLLFQASVLGIPDSTAARKAVQQFKHVLAWLEELEPPNYPFYIDRDKAAKGKTVFEKNCSKCHGTYGEKETYPNKIIALKIIKTDPSYAIYATKSGIVNWYNESWFAQTQPKSFFEPSLGYIAPPLDGIWASAPYLHNGSVPNIYSLLNSSHRPEYWSRDVDQIVYDSIYVGWVYEKEKNSKGKTTYDTSLPAYSNQGHYFGDQLSEQNRMDLIEYLKTI